MCRWIYVYVFAGSLFSILCDIWNPKYHPFQWRDQPSILTYEKIHFLQKEMVNSSERTFVGLNLKTICIMVHLVLPDVGSVWIMKMEAEHCKVGLGFWWLQECLVFLVGGIINYCRKCMNDIIRSLKDMANSLPLKNILSFLLKN